MIDSQSNCNGEIRQRYCPEILGNKQYIRSNRHQVCEILK